MKQSKLKSFEPVIKDGVHSSYTTANGTFYNFIVEMESGDKGQCSSSKTSPSWKVGDEYTYEVVTNGNYTNIKKLKPVNSFGGGGSKYNGAGARVGMAMNNAVAIYIAGKCELDKIEGTADWLCGIAKKLEDKHS